MSIFKIDKRRDWAKLLGLPIVDLTDLSSEGRLAKVGHQDMLIVHREDIEESDKTAIDAMTHRPRVVMVTGGDRSKYPKQSEWLRTIGGIMVDGVAYFDSEQKIALLRQGERSRYIREVLGARVNIEGGDSEVFNSAQAEAYLRQLMALATATRFCVSSLVETIKQFTLIPQGHSLMTQNGFKQAWSALLLCEQSGLGWGEYFQGQLPSTISLIKRLTPEDESLSRIEHVLGVEASIRTAREWLLTKTNTFALGGAIRLLVEMARCRGIITDVCKELGVEAEVCKTVWESESKLIQSVAECAEKEAAAILMWIQHAINQMPIVLSARNDFIVGLLREAEKERRYLHHDAMPQGFLISFVPSDVSVRLGDFENLPNCTLLRLRESLCETMSGGYEQPAIENAVRYWRTGTRNEKALRDRLGWLRKTWEEPPSKTLMKLKEPLRKGHREVEEWCETINSFFGSAEAWRNTCSASTSVDVRAKTADDFWVAVVGIMGWLGAWRAANERPFDFYDEC